MKDVSLYCGDCYDILNSFQDNSIDLFVTSPPYFNAREYSHWNTLDAYIKDMQKIIGQAFRCLKNHHYIVWNVGDVICQVGSSKWNKKRLPLSAIFTYLLSNIEFEFIDDYVWDKGEPQSKRHLGNPPYPYYQYPVNCYEHILVFEKNVLDRTKIPCPVCNKTIIVSNSQTSPGVQSWECKNPQCGQKSASGRGKRYSARSIMMANSAITSNFIDKDFSRKWRRDIVKISPVVKINCKGKNVAGHPAPFPEEIPEMAIRFFSGVDDVVCDPFLGSGTSGVVAYRLGRRFIGIEKEKEYFEIAKQRIEEAQHERC